MKALHALAAGVAAVMLLPSVSAAQGAPAEAGWNFSTDLIYQFSHTVRFDGGTVLDLHDDFGLDVGFGYRFNRNFELTMSLDWNDVDYGGSIKATQSPASVGVHGTMNTFAPRINAVYNFTDLFSGLPLTPYVSAGVGWSFIDTNIPTGQVSVGCWWDPWYGQVCTPYAATHSVDQFTYQFGVGVRWDFGGYYSLRLSYDKNWFDLRNGGTPGLDQIRLGFVFRQ
jgi:opacity protein-like surface antigen